MGGGASAGSQGGSALNPGQTSQFGGIMGTMSNALGGMGNNLMQAYGLKNAQGQWAAGYQPSRNPFAGNARKRPEVEVVNLKDTEDPLPVRDVITPSARDVAQAPVPNFEDDPSIPKGPIPITGAELDGIPDGTKPIMPLKRAAETSEGTLLPIMPMRTAETPDGFAPVMPLKGYPKGVPEGFMRMRGTAYNGLDDKYGDTTARPGANGIAKALEGFTVAVDPRLIPFGKQIQVVNGKGQPISFGGNTSGIFTAHDTGSAVKSRKATRGGSPVIDFFTKGKNLSEADAQLNKDELYFKILQDRAAGKPGMTVAEASQITGDIVR